MKKKSGCGSIELLWAPWRAPYIERIKKDKGCIFCAAKKNPSLKNYCFIKTRYSMGILNLYPYNNGHVMVAPLAHVRSLTALSDAQLLDLFRLAARVKRILSKLLRPHGFNIGINIGKSAGAGFAGHMHVHIVPRWKGDANFMPVIYGARVLSRSLDQLYTKIKHAAGQKNS